MLPGSRPRPAPAGAGRRWPAARVLIAVATVVGTLGGCGKKGPPLAPLLRVPAQIEDLRAQRVDEDVYLRFTVPSANVEGDRPADVARVEVYAVTAARAPLLADADGGDLRRIAMLVASESVLPPPPDGVEDDPAVPGLRQGGEAVLREALTPEARVPVPLLGDANDADAPGIPAARPLVAPVQQADLRRYYFAMGVNRRGRPGPPSILVEAPLGPVSGRPSAPVITYTATELTLEWLPPVDARVSADTPEGLLASRPLTPAPPPTRYNVYLTSPGGDTPAPGEPLNEQPLTAARYDEGSVRFGIERCYVVRPVDVLAGLDVAGPPSPAACETPRDTFPPAAPAALAAVASAGAISLIWEPSDEADLAGYLVLRGEAGDGAADRLQAITPQPIRENTFRDTTVRPGVRYVYAVMAVDTATPPNTSPLSNRVEETARE